jgi:hypothetical protein
MEESSIKAVGISLFWRGFVDMLTLPARGESVLFSSEFGTWPLRERLVAVAGDAAFDDVHATERHLLCIA